MIFYISKCNFLAIFYGLKCKLSLAQKDCAWVVYFCSRKPANFNIAFAIYSRCSENLAIRKSNKLKE